MAAEIEEAAIEKKPLEEIVRFIVHELKPRGKWLTPFNLISIPVIVLGAGLLIRRFGEGLASVTNLSQDFPWGLWIGFDVLAGVAFAGGAYVLTFMVYILRIEKYRSLIRVTVLNGFLAYVFYAGAPLLDLGRPWHVTNPILGNSFGVSSVLFLVAWHFLLYMAAELIEFSPAIAEWLGLQKARKFLSGLTLGAVVFGITLSTLHQSGLGALFLMAKSKIHPLWYSEFLPILFFISSIFAGISMVIVEGTISQKVFRDHLRPDSHKFEERILIGLSQVCAGSMFVYFFLQALVFIHEKNLAYLGSPMGYWYLLEVIGFVLAPLFLFLRGIKRRNLSCIRAAAVITLAGILLNRLNVSIIAFKWYAPVHYVPSWMEVEITLAVIFVEIWVFRWVISRMPVLNPSPEWTDGHAAVVRHPQNAGVTGEAVSWKPRAM